MCALGNESKAVRTLFDTTHASASIPSNDLNAYAFGSMGGHNAVATGLPPGEIGTSAAADFAVNMKRSDIRLGDVVVSTPRCASVGVLPYDRIKNLDGGAPQINGYLHPPPRALRSVLHDLESDPNLGKTPLAVYTRDIAESDEEFAHPGAENDILYMSDYPHPQGKDTCSVCNPARVKAWPSRDSTQLCVHYGLIASGNQVLKNALARDELGRKHGILCFEMEAAGVMNILSSLVIRGIRDDCDSNKNKVWQKYAAATAAAFAKLLSRVRPEVEAAQL
ncbi:Pfs domain protein [Aspergillus floccosus]